ncbi:MAG: hypothetical protein ABIG89_06120 [Candidatus Woesearchaeota archaeon]
MDFTLTKCKTGLSCKAKLNKRQKLNLVKIKRKFDVINDAGIALVLKVQADDKKDKKKSNEKIEVLVHGYGELIFKINDKKVSEKKLNIIAKKIFNAGL